MAINVSSYAKKDKCDLFIEAPDLKMFGGFDFSKSMELFEVGYEYGKKVAEDVKKLLQPEGELK